MEQKEEFKPRKPDYKGDGVSIWKAQAENNETFLKVKVLGGKTICCFSTAPKDDI